MVLAVFRPLVVQGVHVALDAEPGLALEHCRDVPARRGIIAAPGVARGQEGVVQMVGRGDAGKRSDRLAVPPRDEIGPAEVIPEPLRVVRIEPHRLLDPRGALLGLSEPSQDLALLDDDQIVVGV